MGRTAIPGEWDLSATARYKRQNMERAMRGRIERGLVELITNSDDSYRGLEEEGKQVSGQIRLEIERRYKGQPSTVRVKDRAAGMNREEMYKNLGELGARTSGFEKGKPRRGLHGRGARDVAAFGTVHFESIKDGEYNHLIIYPSLKCRFTGPPQKPTSEIRKRLGIPRGNGTVVTIKVADRFRIPRHETLVRDFSRYYSLRDLFCNPCREATLVDSNTGKSDRLVYRYPEGEVVFGEDEEDGDLVIPGYPTATAHLVIRKHESPFEEENLPLREGILVKSAAAIHDCTYFDLESERFAWRFSGELRCDFIDQLVRDYDDREEAHAEAAHPEDNPMRLLDPFRDGLILEHPFAQALRKKGKQVLQQFIDELKAAEHPPEREVTDEDLERRLRQLSRKISRLFERKVRELEEEMPPGLTHRGMIEDLGIGLHIIPAGEYAITVNEPKTFSVIVKDYEPLDESLPVSVTSSHPEDVIVRVSPVLLQRFSEDGRVGRTTFTVESSKAGAEAVIGARYSGYEELLLVKVGEAPPPPKLPHGLSFEKPLYHLRINKAKTLLLRLRGVAGLDGEIIAEIVSDHAEVVVKGGGRCRLHPSEIPEVLTGRIRIQGRQLKARATITARVEGFEPAETRVVVEERPPVSGLKLRFKPVEEDFGAVRYKWDTEDPYFLKIAARDPSIRRYLGEPTEDRYPGVGSALYHAVLAEVIAEALAFRLLEIHFRRDGQGMLDYTSADFHYHRHFSEFLTIAHNDLVAEATQG